MLEHNRHISESVEDRLVAEEHQNRVEEEVEHHHQEPLVTWEPEPVEQLEAVELSLHTSR
mgnify:CR=1 FL=1